MLEFEILARGLFRANQLSMTYDPAQRIAQTAEIGAWMDTFWQEQLTQAIAQQKRLFDAPLFRFLSATIGTDEMLHVSVGDTSYKEYVTTRTPQFASTRQRDELGNALSVCSVVETSDGYILLDRRRGVDVYEGRYHVIGGFFEREQDIAEAGQLPDPFAAMRRELREETGIQQADISEQYCLGVVYDLATPHAEMCFLTQLHISLAETETRQPEDDEIAQMLSLHITETSLRAFILDHHGNISATGEPNLLLYGAWKFGEAWYTEVMSHIAQL